MTVDVNGQFAIDVLWRRFGIAVPVKVLFIIAAVSPFHVVTQCNDQVPFPENVVIRHAVTGCIQIDCLEIPFLDFQVRSALPDLLWFVSRPVDAMVGMTFIATITDDLDVVLAGLKTDCIRQCPRGYQSQCNQTDGKQLLHFPNSQ